LLIKLVNIAVVGEALSKTFPTPSGKNIPFRLVVAGGDDLCLILPEEDVLVFAAHLDAAVRNQVQKLNETSDKVAMNESFFLCTHQ
jgi:CRISPR/Cas system-associated protein Cas10 (large subunit of type III CRISPR-Cas system)